MSMETLDHEDQAKFSQAELLKELTPNLEQPSSAETATENRWATLAERPDLAAKADSLDLASFPRFLSANHTSQDYLKMESLFTDSHVVFPDQSGNEVKAGGFSAPIHLDGKLPENGWEGALEQALANHKDGETPNAVVVLSAFVSEEARGEGMSGKILEAFKEHARKLGYDKLILPVRPSAKRDQPGVPMEEYINHTDPETGLHQDPWVRTHQRHGAEIVGVGKNSHVVLTNDLKPPSVEQWQEWTGLQFPEDGDYAIPEGNGLLHIKDGVGTYSEDCIWVAYDLDTKEAQRPQ